MLNVTNPDNGDFIGKGGKYVTKNSDGSVTLKGYSAQDGATDTIFSDMSVNEIITFHAQPNSGYRAKWSYTDSASHQTKTYYGNSFFFAIQNPYDINDNHITLTFEKTGDDYQTFSFYGQTLLQEGSIINPPTSRTDTYNLVSGAQITMDSYSALSDENGEFHLETNPGNESSEIVKISASKDEIHRALVFYNHRYFICDINMAEYLSSGDVSSITAKLKMQYKTNGVTPTKINAVSSDGTVYGDTITLITANAVQFDVTLDTKGQSADKPVNLVRRSVENEDGIKSKYDVALEKGQTVSHWANTLSEIIKQGDKLYVNGKAYDSITESVWFSAQAKAFDFYYTLPKGQRADDVSMYFTVTEDGEEKLVSDSFAFKYGVDLEITALTLSEMNLITEDNDNAKFFVRATVQNKGNENYTGGDYVRLVYHDVEEMCKAIEDDYEAENPIYTSFGRELINSIEIGNTTEVCFISEDIPSQVFEKTGTDTAYLECIISDKNEPDWKTRNSEEKFSAISEFYPGLTSKPVPKTAQSLNISDITVQVNKQQKLSKSVQPVSSLINSKITYSTSDESVATVDDFGVVTGHKEGKAVITAKIDGISDAAEVTVSNTPVPTQPSETEPTGDISSTENTDNTQPSVSKGNGAHTDGDAGVMQTGRITMTIIILIMLASAAVVFFLRKRRNGN